MNEEYTEAEERFLLALDRDSTDYQALLNPGFPAVHRNSGSDAHTYFKKALTLPPQLDDSAKARAHWATARLHYAEAAYDRALKSASLAIQLETDRSAGNLFTMGAYALDGDPVKCISLVREAVQASPELFARAAVDPDFDVVRSDILVLLSDMATAVVVKVRKAIDASLSDLDKLERSEHAQAHAPVRENSELM